MKYLLIVISIVLIITALDLYISNSIEDSAERMLHFIGEAEDAVQQRDMALASKRIETMRQEWEENESRWEVYIDHRETEQVDTLLTRLEAMVASNTPELMLPEFEELEFFLTHINEKQKFRAENIL